MHHWIWKLYRVPFLCIYMLTACWGYPRSGHGTTPPPLPLQFFLCLCVYIQTSWGENHSANLQQILHLYWGYVWKPRNWPQTRKWGHLSHLGALLNKCLICCSFKHQSSRWFTEVSITKSKLGDPAWVGYPALHRKKPHIGSGTLCIENVEIL